MSKIKSISAEEFWTINTSLPDNEFFELAATVGLYPEDFSEYLIEEGNDEIKLVDEPTSTE
jgi:hypothetical protein